ncbi:hypothetical protein GGR56DRAFT_665263 [Xylariaceae sp. FL0804]|nr:hypothetical protein GGR56DRAFT_665263 [Xylariaceae sp. FL0804]
MASSSSASPPSPSPSPYPSASQLHSPTTYVTGHSSSSSSKAIVLSARPAAWTAFEGGAMGMAPVWTNTWPADLNGGADVAAHDRVLAEGRRRPLGLVLRSGVVCRHVDFAPRYACMMHRTQSLDFGVLLEGTVDMVLDGGDGDDGNGDGVRTRTRTRLRRGDVAVQRATMHAWENPSETEWARMLFVLQDSKPLFVNGERMREDYGKGTEGLEPSGNDV